MQRLAAVRGGMSVVDMNWNRLRPRLISRGILQPHEVPQRNLSIRALAGAAKKQAEALVYRKLGDSDLVISEITLGTMTWGHQNTDKEGQEQLAYAFDQGINILDTSEAFPVPMNKETFGSTDRIIAGWLKTVPRDKVVIATKVVDVPTDFPISVMATPPLALIGKTLKKAWRRVYSGLESTTSIFFKSTDRYVPMFGEYFYETSKFRDSIPFEEQLKAFQEVIQEGKVRYIGVSNETSFGVMEFLHAAKTMGLPKIVSIQNSYSLLVRCHFEVDLVEVCSPQNGNVGLLAYSPLAGGTLSGKYNDPKSDAANKGRLHLFPGYLARHKQSLAKEAVDAYLQVAKRHNLTAPQLALGFCRDRPFVTSTIIGATTMDQLEENITAFQLSKPLSQEINEEIDNVFKRFRDPPII